MTGQIRLRIRLDEGETETLLCIDRKKESLKDIVLRAASRLGVAGSSDGLGLCVDFGNRQTPVDSVKVLFHDDCLVLKTNQQAGAATGPTPTDQPGLDRQDLTNNDERSVVENKRKNGREVKEEHDIVDLTNSDEDIGTREILAPDLVESNPDKVASLNQKAAATHKGKQKQSTVARFLDPDDGDDDDENDSDFEESDLEESDLEVSDSDCSFRARTTPPPKKKKKIAASDPPLEVVIPDQHLPDAPGTSVAEIPDKDYEFQPELSGVAKAESEVKDRIMKLLNMGFHDGSNENEAKRAMKMAQKLMKRHNLSQALILKERDLENSDSMGALMKGGLVSVNIINRRTEKPSLFLRWFSCLISAIEHAFEVKSYRQVGRGVMCRLTFYGIYTNCQLASYAFKTAAERISVMQATFVPEKTCYVTTNTARLSYAMGISSGLFDEARQTKKCEEEAQQRKLYRARQSQSKGEAYEDSDVEVEDGGGESDEEIGFPFAYSKPAGEPNKETGWACHTPSTRLEELERHNEAAIVLADQNEKIQEEVLKEKGVKISSGRKRRRLRHFSRMAFAKGEKDSREIDLKQRAIRDDWNNKVKKEKQS